MNKDITPELAEICGIHAGDGYLRVRERNKGEVDISGDLEEKEYYDSHVIPLFNNFFNLNIIGRIFSRGTYGFVTYNKSVRNRLIGLGFPIGKKSKIVRIPKIILEHNDKLIYTKFLRGLFDTDGCLTFKRKTGNYSEFKLKHHYYPTISIVTISKKLSEEVSFLLNQLNLKHFIYGYQPKNPRDNYRYAIIINGVERLEQWMNLIGTKNSSKLSRYLIWKKYGFCPTPLTFQERKDILRGKIDIYSLGPIA